MTSMQMGSSAELFKFPQEQGSNTEPSKTKPGNRKMLFGLIGGVVGFFAIIIIGTVIYKKSHTRQLDAGPNIRLTTVQSEVQTSNMPAATSAAPRSLSDLDVPGLQIPKHGSAPITSEPAARKIPAGKPAQQAAAPAAVSTETAPVPHPATMVPASSSAPPATPEGLSGLTQAVQSLNDVAIQLSEQVQELRRENRELKSQNDRFVKLYGQMASTERSANRRIHLPAQKQDRRALKEPEQHYVIKAFAGNAAWVIERGHPTDFIKVVVGTPLAGYGIVRSISRDPADGSTIISTDNGVLKG